MKAILVIEIADDVVEAYDGFTVDYDLRGRPKEDGFYTESIKYVEDADVRPLPQKIEVEVNEIEDIMHTEFSIDDICAKIRLDTDKIFSLGWNACLDDIEGEKE